MQRRKSNHVIPGANAAKGQGQGAGYNEEAEWGKRIL